MRTRTRSRPHNEETERPPEAAGMESRREFLAKCASAIFAGAVIGAQPLEAVARAAAPLAGAPAVAAPPFRISEQADEDVLIRMQRELQRALQKPVEQRRWGMVIDTRKCTGCAACTVACVMENKLPPGVVYRPVIDSEIGTYPNVTRKFLPRPCMQCDNPPCVPVCPVGATTKRPDGIVQIDYNACIGCRYCITACPYQARTFDFGESWTEDAAQGPNGDLALLAGRSYQQPPNFEYGKEWTRTDSSPLAGLAPRSPVGNARKCHFCAHRLEQGLLPMCVSSCLGRATVFGDLNDPGSLASELRARGNAVRLKEEVGTEPKVYYLV